MSYLLLDAAGDNLGGIGPDGAPKTFATVEQADLFAMSHTRHPVRHPEPWRVVVQGGPLDTSADREAWARRVSENADREAEILAASGAWFDRVAGEQARLGRDLTLDELDALATA